MKLQDDVKIQGIFSIYSIDKNGNVIDKYEEKNLIMDRARQNMAQLIGNVTTDASLGQPINKFVIGTLGHVGTDILNYKRVGENGFTSTRTSLFSEENSSALNYLIEFSVAGGTDVTVQADGKRRKGLTVEATESAVKNTIRRIVGGDQGRTVTYEITIPAENGNSGDPANPVVAYTEAALYAGNDIFSMKTFPARVKENTVELKIVWSIIF